MKKPLKENLQGLFVLIASVHQYHSATGFTELITKHAQKLDPHNFYLFPGQA